MGTRGAGIARFQSREAITPAIRHITLHGQWAVNRGYSPHGWEGASIPAAAAARLSDGMDWVQPWCKDAGSPSGIRSDSGSKALENLSIRATGRWFGPVAR